MIESLISIQSLEEMRFLASKKLEYDMVEFENELWEF